MLRDTGIGIPADTRDRLFRRFSQVSVTVSPDQGGTGLGLAISKALVERMSGTIGFESKVGQGSTFWFEVALARRSGKSRRCGRPDRSLRRTFSHVR